MNTAYNMDCMEAMRQMPDKCFDLAVVDPPYGINAAKMHGGLGNSPRCAKKKIVCGNLRIGMLALLRKNILTNCFA